MARLVNYAKRSISLPAGCKDLIDLLQPSRRKSSGPELGGGPPPPLPKHDRFVTGGLAQIERYVSRSLESSADIFFIYICSLEEQFGTVLRRIKSTRTFEMVPLTGFGSRPELQQAVVAFFDQHGIQAIQDRGIAGIGTSGSFRLLEYSLPIDASLISELTMNLFRNAYGLNDESELNFYYFECPAAI